MAEHGRCATLSTDRQGVTHTPRTPRRLLLSTDRKANRKKGKIN
jgi:hypothetical protein